MGGKCTPPEEFAAAIDAHTDAYIDIKFGGYTKANWERLRWTEERLAYDVQNASDVGLRMLLDTRYGYVQRMDPKQIEREGLMDILGPHYELYMLIDAEMRKREKRYTD